MSGRSVRLAAIAAVAAALAGVVSAPARAADRDPATVLVKFSIPSQITGALAAFGDRVGARMTDNVVLVRLPAGTSVDTAVSRYARIFGVAYAEPNYIATADALAAPNDPSFSAQWSLGRISAVAGWSRLFTTYPASLDGALIAVNDTGVQANHPDLAGRVLTGANCLAGFCTSGGSADDNNHGTHVAGIAVASTNNGVGIAGVALTSKILPVKVLDSSGTGSYAAISAGIDWAVSQGAKVINMSLSGSQSSSTLCAAVSRAVSAGVAIVAAAGNSGYWFPAYPAACAGSIGVAATDSSDQRASYSNYGSPDVFVSAPGSAIYSTIAGSSYATFNGTSMAAPHVAGLAALLATQTPGLTVPGLKTILATTSDKLGLASSYGSDPYATCAGCTWSADFGYGRINIDRALSGGGAPPPPPPPPPGGTLKTTSPTAVTLVSGSVRGGGAASLAGADGVYYLVRSPFFGNPSWYGTFATDANAADFKATFSGLTSRTCTLNLAIYRWPTGTWVAMGSPATINTYVTTVSDAAPSTSLPASELRSASGEVRVRATCSAPASFSQWTLSSDLLRLSYVS